MAHGDGETDAERRGSVQVGPLRVARCEHGKHEHERDEELHGEALLLRQGRVDVGVSEPAGPLLGRGHA